MRVCGGGGQVETLSAQELSLLQYPVQVTAVNVAEGQEGTASAVYRITGVIRGKPFSVMKSVSALDRLCVDLAKVGACHGPSSARISGFGLTVLAVFVSAANFNSTPTRPCSAPRPCI